MSVFSFLAPSPPHTTPSDTNLHQTDASRAQVTELAIQARVAEELRRIQAAETGATSAIAESIAQDKELTKALLEAAGVPGGPINRIYQILADPQIAARGLLKRMERRDGTPVTVIGYPSRLSRN